MIIILQEWFFEFIMFFFFSGSCAKMNLWSLKDKFIRKHIIVKWREP